MIKIICKGDFRQTRISVPILIFARLFSGNAGKETPANLAGTFLFILA